MCSDGVASMRGDRTVNLSISAIGTRLWALCELLRRHVLDILRSYILWDVYQPEIPPNHHVILALYTVISSVFFGFFLRFIPKITKPTSINEFYMS